MHTLVTTAAIALPVITVILACVFFRAGDVDTSTRCGIGACVAFFLNVLCAVVFYDTTESTYGMTIWFVIIGIIGFIIVVCASDETV